MNVKQAGNGDYYLCSGKMKSGKRKIYRNLFLVKHHGENNTCGYVNGIILPKALIGKKVMFKVEVQKE